MTSEGVAIEMCRDGESSVSVSIEDDGAVRLTAAQVKRIAPPPSFRVSVLSTSDLAPDDAQQLGEALIRAAQRSRGSRPIRPISILLGDEMASDSPRARQARAEAAIAKALYEENP